MAYLASHIYLYEEMLNKTLIINNW